MLKLICIQRQGRPISNLVSKFKILKISVLSKYIKITFLINKSLAYRNEIQDPSLSPQEVNQ